MHRRPRSPEHFIRAVGLRVRELRLARGLTQERFAEKLGVATQYVQAVERGVRNLTLATVWRVAEALDVEPIQLFASPRLDATAGKPGRPTKEYLSAHTGAATVAILDSRAREAEWGAPSRPSRATGKRRRLPRK